MPAKPLRTALGSLLIQKQLGFSDREFVEEIREKTCAPQNITYPQDVNLLNEARENLEHIIDTLCYEFSCYKPRMYCKNARRDYLNLAKTKKRTGKRIRKAIK